MAGIFWAPRPEGKFAPSKSEMQRESSLREMEPKGEVMRADMAAFFDQQIAKAQGQKKLIWELYKAEMVKNEVPSRIKKEFARGFRKWLHGKGLQSEHEKTPWGTYKIKHNANVAGFFDQFIDKKSELERNVARLKYYVESRGPEVVSVGALYLYYKYIIQGMTPVTAEFYDEFNQMLEDDFHNPIVPVQPDASNIRGQAIYGPPPANRLLGRGHPNGTEGMDRRTLADKALGRPGTPPSPRTPPPGHPGGPPGPDDRPPPDPNSPPPSPMDIELPLGSSPQKRLEERRRVRAEEATDDEDDDMPVLEIEEGSEFEGSEFATDDDDDDDDSSVNLLRRLVEGQERALQARLEDARRTEERGRNAESVDKAMQMELSRLQARLDDAERQLAVVNTPPRAGIDEATLAAFAERLAQARQQPSIPPPPAPAITLDDIRRIVDDRATTAPLAPANPPLTIDDVRRVLDERARTEPVSRPTPMSVSSSAASSRVPSPTPMSAASSRVPSPTPMSESSRPSSPALPTLPMPPSHSPPLALPAASPPPPRPSPSPATVEEEQAALQVLQSLLMPPPPPRPLATTSAASSPATSPRRSRSRSSSESSVGPGAMVPVGPGAMVTQEGGDMARAADIAEHRTRVESQRMNATPRMESRIPSSVATGSHTVNIGTIAEHMFGRAREATPEEMANLGVVIGGLSEMERAGLAQLPPADQANVLQHGGDHARRILALPAPTRPAMASLPAPIQQNLLQGDPNLAGAVAQNFAATIERESGITGDRQPTDLTRQTQAMVAQAVGALEIGQAQSVRVVLETSPLWGTREGGEFLIREFAQLMANVDNIRNRGRVPTGTIEDLRKQVSSATDQFLANARRARIRTAVREEDEGPPRAARRLNPVAAQEAEMARRLEAAAARTNDAAVAQRMADEEAEAGQTRKKATKKKKKKTTKKR